MDMNKKNGFVELSVKIRPWNFILQRKFHWKFCIEPWKEKKLPGFSGDPR